MYNWENPIIPEGFEYLEGEPKTGFVTRRPDDGSTFVWVPVDYLDEDGILCGKNSKFGKRFYEETPERVEFLKNDILDETSDILKYQIVSVSKYGGFYVSQFHLSVSETSVLAVSEKNKNPLTDNNVAYAQFTAGDICEVSCGNSEGLGFKDDLASHLLLPEEYDSIVAWLIKSGALTREQAIDPLLSPGNILREKQAARIDYDENSVEWCTKNAFYRRQYIEQAYTGYSEEWKLNNLYDFGSNVGECTFEKSSKDPFCGYDMIVRGGSYWLGKGIGNRFVHNSGRYHSCGVRAALHIP